MLGALLAVALPIFGASRIWPENRRLQRRLAAQRADEVPFSADAVMIENLVSLAVASSMAAEARSGRLQRRIGAVIGAIGVFGWAGAAAAGASVGLASTGNLPDPVQRVVADVLEVVNIEVPRPVSSTIIVPADDDDEGTENPVDDQSDAGSDANAADNGVAETGDGPGDAGNDGAGGDGAVGTTPDGTVIAPADDDDTNDPNAEADGTVATSTSTILAGTTPGVATTTTQPAPMATGLPLPPGLDIDDLPPGLDPDDLPPGLAGDNPSATAPGNGNSNGNGDAGNSNGNANNSNGNANNSNGNSNANANNSNGNSNANNGNSNANDDDDSVGGSNGTTTTTLPIESWNPVYPGPPGNSGNTPGRGNSNNPNVESSDEDEEEDEDEEGDVDNPGNGNGNANGNGNGNNGNSNSRDSNLDDSATRAADD